jgi:hypothetical protein
MAPSKKPRKSSRDMSPEEIRQLAIEHRAEEARLLAIKDPPVGSHAWYVQVEARADKMGDLLYDLYKQGKLGRLPKPAQKTAAEVRQEMCHHGVMPVASIIGMRTKTHHKRTPGTPQTTASVSPMRRMKFKDPHPIVCNTCGVSSKLPVKDLLARQARCPGCGRLLTDISDGMHALLDEGSGFVAAMFLTIRLEEQNPGLRYDEAILKTIHSLQDLVDATEAAMNELPAPERGQRSLDAVRAAFSDTYPQVAFPPLTKRLCDVVRGSLPF